jgi:hypothetical protein
MQASGVVHLFSVVAADYFSAKTKKMINGSKILDLPPLYNDGFVAKQGDNYFLQAGILLLCALETFILFLFFCLVIVLQNRFPAST